MNETPYKEELDWKNKTLSQRFDSIQFCKLQKIETYNRKIKYHFLKTIDYMETF